MQSTSEVFILDLNFAIKSCAVTGAPATTAVLISSSVIAAVEGDVEPGVAVEDGGFVDTLGLYEFITASALTIVCQKQKRKE